MRLITFQDIFVIKKIQFEQAEKRPPVYFNREIIFQQREMTAVNKLIDMMKTSLNLPMDRQIVPIWCWVVPKSKEVDDDYLNELYDRFIPHCKRLTMYELEVPNDGVMVTNFDVWDEIFFNLKFGIDVSDELFNKLFEKQKGARLQACIPFIHKDFITKIKYFNRGKDGDYKDTENEIQKMIDNGEISLDKDGNIWSISEENNKEIII